MAAIEIALRTYARRAREFSDLVALLGRHNSIGPEVLKLFKKIKRQICVVMLESDYTYTMETLNWTAQLNDKY